MIACLSILQIPTRFELNENAADILRETEIKCEAMALRPAPCILWTRLTATGRVRVDQGVIAGCAGGIYDNLSAAADILRGKNIGNGLLPVRLSASQPVLSG